MNLQNKKIVITGGAGFLGSHLVNKLKSKGAKDIFVPLSKDYDLRDKKACAEIVKDADVVIHLAAQMGGIGFIDEHQGEVFYNNLIMGVQLMEEARKARVGKFVGIGTACEYPEVIPLPFKESDIWNGSPEDATAPYGWAKKMLLIQGKAYKKQYGFNAIHILPVNLYGPGDNFDPGSSPVIPSLIRKIVIARDSNSSTIEVWGTGRATREFLYVEDAAEGIILATEKYNEVEPINLGTGVETSIKSVVELIMKIAKYKGSIVWNSNKPDGQPRRQLDISRAQSYGFAAKTDLEDGLRKTISWYESNRAI